MHDEFVGLYSVPQTDAGTITTVTTECVLRVEHTSEQVFRQCYTRAGNILAHGQRTGVATTDLESRAVSSHCDGHALNLTASGMLKQCAV